MKTQTKLISLVAAVAIAAGSALAWWQRAPAPQAQFIALAGGNFSTADLQGKVVLVNFWATWCVPCREEMPSMERLRGALQGKPFVVLAVNVGEGARAARAFGEKTGLGFPLLLDPDTKTTRAWNARVLPASFVVGPDGRIRYSYFGAIDWARDDVRVAIENLLR